MKAITSVILGLVIFAVQQAHGQKCRGLARQADRCRSNNFDLEYRCISEENGLRAIMDCVTIQGGAERLFCRDAEDGNLRTSENYYIYNGKGPKDVCIKPRTALLLMSRNICVHCGLTGVLRACPMDDPCFLQCVCEYQVTDAHLWCLSNCFNTGFTPPTCAGYACSRSHRKRHAARITSRETVENDATDWMKHTELTYRVFYTGFFEFFDFYKNARLSSYRLPFIERSLSGGMVERCYVSPVSPRVYCWELFVGARYTVPVYPDRATFTTTNEISGGVKTETDAHQTQSSVSVRRIEVPTQKPDDEDKGEKGKGDEVGGEKSKGEGTNGVSSSFQAKLSLTLALSALVLIRFIVV